MLPRIFGKFYVRSALQSLKRSQLRRPYYCYFTTLRFQLKNFKDLNNDTCQKNLNTQKNPDMGGSRGDRLVAIQKYNNSPRNKDFDHAIKKLKTLLKDQENRSDLQVEKAKSSEREVLQSVRKDDGNATTMTEQSIKVANAEEETSTKDANVNSSKLPLKERVVAFISSITNGENFRQLKEELVKFNERRAKKQDNYKQSISLRLGQDVTELRKSIGIASRVVNDVTGYSKVNALKEKIATYDQKLKSLREEITRAKDDFSSAIERRSESQREMNDLLERKSSWVPSDLKRFTELYMNEHELEREVKLKKMQLDEMDQRNDETHDNLIKSIMDRYHEEQVWSDKIRQFSTWGTVLIMVCNLLLVFLVQLVFEPFKRYRLVRSFENKVRDIFDRNEEMGTDLKILKDDLDSRYDTLLDKIEENEQNIMGKLPGQNINARVLPEDLSFSSIKHWISFTFGKLLNPLTDSSSETFTITRSDIQYFVYFLSSMLLLTGCFIGKFL